MNLTRRRFVGFGTLLTASASLGFAGLRGRSKVNAQSGPVLVPDPSGIVDLPPGFTYRVLQRAGDAQTDGAKVRGALDGMAAFAGEPGQVILMRNHELGLPSGGVSRLVVDLATLTVLSSNDVLTGTNRNCAGGPSPWGWLTCEEVTNGKVWLCPLDASRVLSGDERRAIDAYGIFKHEAVCIDPDGLVAYLTEDDGASYLYRMVPSDPAADPFSGRLQALKVVGQDDFDTASMTVDQSLEVEWVDVEPETARADARARRAAVVWRGEGIWWFDGVVYFTATSNNQVFELVPSATGGTMRLIAKDLKGPDNITVAPWGDLFVAEDHGGICRIRVIDAAGNVSDFARNALALGQEFAGVCFSPDGKVLFVNLQWSGHTLAITGPFETRPLPMPPPMEDAGVPASDAGTGPNDAGNQPADAAPGGATDAGAERDGGDVEDGGDKANPSPPDGGPSNGDGDSADPSDPDGCMIGSATRRKGLPALTLGALGAALLWRRGTSGSGTDEDA